MSIQRHLSSMLEMNVFLASTNTSTSRSAAAHWKQHLQLVGNHHEPPGERSLGQRSGCPLQTLQWPLLPSHHQVGRSWEDLPHHEPATQQHTFRYRSRTTVCSVSLNSMSSQRRWQSLHYQKSSQKSLLVNYSSALPTIKRAIGRNEVLRTFAKSSSQTDRDSIPT